MDDLDYLDEIISEFIVETEELLEQLDTDLVALENSPNDLELMNKIFRGVHTIKGTSGFLGFEKMTRLTHAAEDLLNRLRKGSLRVTADIMDVILETVDALRKMLEAIKLNGQEGEVDYEKIAQKLKAMLNSQSAASELGAGSM
ncbi:MAG: hybrid sensor histidine kinase/response regulator, partial [Calditrichaeota bacterium]